MTYVYEIEMEAIPSAQPNCCFTAYKAWILSLHYAEVAERRASEGKNG